MASSHEQHLRVSGSLQPAVAGATWEVALYCASENSLNHLKTSVKIL